MPEGTVKWFSEDKGYGFIRPDDGSEDVFVHHTGIAGGGFKSLQEGDKVTYEAGQGKSGMTERDHRTGSGGVKDNVRDELAEAAGYRKEATPEEEEQAGSGGVKDTVRDELAESQERR
jgi:cold shock protein